VLFNSYEFLFGFLPICLVGFFIIARYSRGAALAWLTLASVTFYTWWDPRNLPLLIGSIAFNFLAGQAILRTRTEGRSDLCKLVTYGAIACNLVAIAYYKYFNFLGESIGAPLGVRFVPQSIDLPIGISFFTFTQIAFLVDAYRGEVRHFGLVRYSLFVSYFPHLIAGPILHHRETMSQFSAARMFKPKATHFAVGLSIFALGLAKKVLLADEVAMYASPLFDAAKRGHPLSFFDAWLGSVAYGFQIYFDFSAYSDMAIGLSYLFGVRIPLNFNSPYQSTSIIEFWRRWHMSLSRFLRDYLYFSLGGNRCGLMRQRINLMSTMLLGGLWHGASWNFVIWGGLHGIFLVVVHAYRAAFPRRRFGRWGKVLAWSATMLCVTVAWVFFRADGLESALRIVAAMAGMNGIEFPNAVGGWFATGTLATLNRFGMRFDGAFRVNVGDWSNGVVVLCGCAVIAFLLPNVHRMFRRYRPAIEIYPLGAPAPLWRALPNWRPSAAWAVVVAGLFLVGVMRLTRPSQFLYFQF